MQSYRAWFQRSCKPSKKPSLFHAAVSAKSKPYWLQNPHKYFCNIHHIVSFPCSLGIKIFLHNSDIDDCKFFQSWLIEVNNCREKSFMACIRFHNLIFSFTVVSKWQTRILVNITLQCAPRDRIWKNEEKEAKELNELAEMHQWQRPELQIVFPPTISDLMCRLKIAILCNLIGLVKRVFRPHSRPLSCVKEFGRKLKFRKETRDPLTAIRYMRTQDEFWVQYKSTTGMKLCSYSFPRIERTSVRHGYTNQHAGIMTNTRQVLRNKQISTTSTCSCRFHFTSII